MKSLTAAWWPLRRRAEPHTASATSLVTERGMAAAWPPGLCSGTTPFPVDAELHDDEIDMVLEGELHVRAMKAKGKAGDVMFIPKAPALNLAHNVRALFCVRRTAQNWQSRMNDFITETWLRGESYAPAKDPGIHLPADARRRPRPGNCWKAPACALSFWITQGPALFDHDDEQQPQPVHGNQ